MGADNFVKIVNWQESNILLSKYKYIVIEREDIDLKGYINTHKINNVQIVKNDKYKNCSATKFRKLICKNTQDNQDIIAREVLDFIIENDIY